MKAIIISAPGEIKIIEAPKPRAGDFSDTDVVIKVMYSGICGTDLGIFSGKIKIVRDGSVKYPVRIGHEWSGVVESVGKNVKELKPGDRVVSDSGVTCGICDNCLKGDYGSCAGGRAIGTINCWDGSFAEYMLIPERHLYKIPDAMSLEEAAFIEPASIALAGIKKCGIKQISGSSVLVTGTGPIGLLSAALAKAAGADKVIVSGRTPSKLAAAKLMGADIAADISKQDLRELIMSETGGKGADYVIETSGNSDAIKDCVDCVSHRGSVVLVGFYENLTQNFDADIIVTKEARVIGVMGELGLPEKAMAMITENNISMLPMITHRINFEDVINVFYGAGERQSERIKIIVKIQE
jgi:L-iditol 2-dehydrogenase